MHDLVRTCPKRIRTARPDKGKEITDHLFGFLKRPATSKNQFDRLCAALEIENRLTPPKSSKQRYGRMFQRVSRRRSATPLLPTRRGTGGDPVLLRLARQPATAVINLAQQDAQADDEGLAQTQDRVVKETVIPTLWMRHV